ncbi:MAG: HAD-IIIA family hydrolase [Pseudomonadota bacterium]
MPEVSPDTAAAEALGRQIKLAVFDVDGVMTDGRLIYNERGEELKAFHSQDGLGLKRLAASGVQLGVITGRDNPVVAHRMRELGIERVVAGCETKDEALRAMAEELKVPLSQVAFMGDDVIDIPAMELAGLAATVPNAHASALAVADWVAPRPGGAGGVRDFCDWLMGLLT